jgi:hypothetical protein
MLPVLVLYRLCDNVAMVATLSPLDACENAMPPFNLKAPAIKLCKPLAKQRNMVVAGGAAWQRWL